MSEQTPGRSIWRRSVWVSVLIHAALLGLLIWLPYQFWPRAAQQQQQQRQAEAAAREAGRVEGNAPAESAEELPEGAPPGLTAERVLNKLAQQREAVEDLSDDEKLQKLDEHAKWLKENSNPESVEQIAKAAQGWLNLKPRATAPAKEPAEGQFDHDTAQFYEVDLKKNEAGQEKYHIVMLDAEGRTFNLVLTDAEAEAMRPALEMMMKMKTNPALRSIYLQIVMPMLDDLLKNQRAGSQNKK